MNNEEKILALLEQMIEKQDQMAARQDQMAARPMEAKFSISLLVKSVYATNITPI